MRSTTQQVTLFAFFSVCSRRDNMQHTARVGYIIGAHGMRPRKTCRRGTRRVGNRSLPLHFASLSDRRKPQKSSQGEMGQLVHVYTAKRFNLENRSIAAAFFLLLRTYSNEHNAIQCGQFTYVKQSVLLSVTYTLVLSSIDTFVTNLLGYSLLSSINNLL